MSACLEDLYLDLQALAATAHEILSEDYCTKCISYDIAKILDNAVEEVEAQFDEVSS